MGGEDPPSLVDEGWRQLGVGEPSKGAKPEARRFAEGLRTNGGVGFEAMLRLESPCGFSGLGTEGAVERPRGEPLGEEELLPTENVGAAVALSEDAGHGDFELRRGYAGLPRSEQRSCSRVRQQNCPSSSQEVSKSRSLTATELPEP